MKKARRRSMPRNPRYFESGCVYEIVFRAKSSLPFVAYTFMNYVIQCVLARVQRDNKVILCHDLWNGSHPHLIVVSKDAEQLRNFYAEVEKKITDILKRLLGRDYLNVWEDHCSVSKLGDLEAAKNHIAYLYANPGKDHLEENIESYPGSSSWSQFQQCQSGLDTEVSEVYPWLRLNSIPRISDGGLSIEQDLEVLAILKEKNKELHTLTRFPNAWMKCFGVEEENVSQINAQIIASLRSKEAVAREERILTGRRVMGANKLRREPLLKSHTPKKRSGKIYIITTIKEVRLEFMNRMEEFKFRCRDCYRRWRNGEIDIKWPPEAFKPSFPPILNLLPS